MIILQNETNIKQFKIYLNLIKELKHTKELTGTIKSNEDIMNLMCSFEEELKRVNENLSTNHNLILNHLYFFSLRDFMTSFQSDKRNMCGAEILFTSEYSCLIRDLMKEKTFDINRIDELIALVDKLIELNIKKATFSGDKPFDLMKKFSKNHSGYTTYVSNDLNFEEIDEEGKVFLSKCFSDKPYFYTELAKLRWTKNKHYQIAYTEEPNWIISGEVGYYLKEREIYTGISSPHTEFNFSASTLYPNLSSFPTKEEIFSLSHPKTLSLYLKK